MMIVFMGLGPSVAHGQGVPVVSLLEAQHNAARSLAGGIETGAAGQGCAVIGIGPEGYLRTSELDIARCGAETPSGWEVVATVVTTSTSEPSANALAAAVAVGQDRYVITPEGHLWFLDAFAAEQSLLCGPGCAG
jgi:hypothetical protein